MNTMLIDSIGHRSSVAAAGRRSVAALMASLERCMRRWRGRHHLAELDDRLLRDIGVSRAQAMWESEKPFWR